MDPNEYEVNLKMEWTWMGMKWVQMDLNGSEWFPWHTLQSSQVVTEVQILTYFQSCVAAEFDILLVSLNLMVKNNIANLYHHSI